MSTNCGRQKPRRPWGGTAHGTGARTEKKRFPGLPGRFARLGEQTGELPQMLDHAARQLGAKVQRRALALATLLGPLLIVVMGLVVMLIVLAMLLPSSEPHQRVR